MQKNFTRGEKKLLKLLKLSLYYDDAFEEQVRYEEEEKTSEKKMVSLIIKSLGD